MIESERATQALEKAMAAADAYKRPLVLRLAGSIYHFVSSSQSKRVPKKARALKKDGRFRGGTYLGWPGMTTRFEVKSVKEARAFERAVNTFAELVAIFGPKVVAEQLEALRPKL